MSDDYAKIKFCFNDYPSDVTQIDKEVLNNFYPGFIETNYLFIDKFLTQKDDSNNVSKAKKFIIDLAIQYYKNNNDSKKQKILEEQKNLITIEKQEEVTASLVFAPSEKDYNAKINQRLLFGGGNGEDTNEDTNNLLICIMKNIMLTNKNDFDIIKNKYNIMN